MSPTPHKRGSHKRALHTGDPVKQPSGWAPCHLLGRKPPLAIKFHKGVASGGSAPRHWLLPFLGWGCRTQQLGELLLPTCAPEVPFFGGALVSSPALSPPVPTPRRLCLHPGVASSPPPYRFLSWSLGPPCPQLPPQTLALSCGCSQAVQAPNPGKPGTSFPQGGWLVDSTLLCKLFLRILFYSSTQ